MRVLLTAMMIALLSQPAVAAKVYYCNVTDFAATQFGGGTKLVRANPFKFSVDDYRVVFGKNDIIGPREFRNVQSYSGAIFATEGSRPDLVFHFYGGEELYVSGRSSMWVSFRATCEAFD